MEERFLVLIRLAIKYNVTEIYFSNSYYYSEIEMKVDGIYRKVKPKLEDGQMIGYLKHLAGLNISPRKYRCVNEIISLC